MVVKYLVATASGIWASENGVDFTRLSFSGDYLQSYLVRSFSGRSVIHSMGDSMYSHNDPVSEIGSSWDKGLVGSVNLIRDGVYASGKCVLAAHQFSLYISSNCKDFSQVSIGDGSYYTCCYHNGQFIAAGSSVNPAVSSDGVSWSVGTALPFANVFCMRSAFGRIFVAGANGVIRSATTLAGPWTTHDIGPTVTNVCMTYENGILVIGCDNGIIKYTLDGVNWSYTGNGQGLIRRITYSGGKWYSVSDNGTIGVSTNFPSFVNTAILFNGGFLEIHDIVVYNDAKINGSFSGSGVRAFMSIKSMGGTLEIPIASQTTSSLTIDPAFIENWGRPSGPVKIMVVDGEYVSDWIDWEFK